MNGRRIRRSASPVEMIASKQCRVATGHSSRHPYAGPSSGAREDGSRYRPRLKATPLDDDRHRRQALTRVVRHPSPCVCGVGRPDLATVLVSASSPFSRLIHRWPSCASLALALPLPLLLPSPRCPARTRLSPLPPPFPPSPTGQPEREEVDTGSTENTIATSSSSRISCELQVLP